MANNKFYITSAIPYVNAKPHIGHAFEFVEADAIARYHKIIGDETLLLCGSDDNALKNVQAAEKENIPVQQFIDNNSNLFLELSKKLNVRFDIFQKGSAPAHHKSSQKLWERCRDDIYKKDYKGLYCVGCEQFYEKDELDENGECIEHSGKKLEVVSEENYFFKLSKYTEQIKKLIEDETVKIIPETRKNEILSFLKGGLKDISISRSNERAKNWGVSVPGDDTQKMYVWFDALNIYQSGIGFGTDEEKYKKWWPADLHVIGKGILRFHAVYWPAFLLSAKLELPKTIFVHEYITVNGQKMSKTLGNVIDPIELINKYGADALRYYFLRQISPFADGDFSQGKFIQSYNADLANGLGNLVARVAKLCETSNHTQLGSENRISSHLVDVEVYSDALSNFRFNDALSYVWNKISELDKYIDGEKPWKLSAGDSKLKAVLSHAVDQIQEIAALLEPFLPETAGKIQEQFKGPRIYSTEPLFPRL
ncbi:MAG: methionine--tRNA ligase [Candidatus Levybacteria bacterium]|nr:methionine--tRNA ligase [Candidatus Levybacteria bacterium]